jgi:hypothetical protein
MKKLQVKKEFIINVAEGSRLDEALDKDDNASEIADYVETLLENDESFEAALVSGTIEITEIQYNLI